MEILSETFGKVLFCLFFTDTALEIAWAQSIAFSVLPKTAKMPYPKYLSIKPLKRLTTGETTFK